jgi:pectin methylesterase-like acyl-CoA thioesterase
MLATWTVDPGGGGDFTTIQAAVTAVQSDGNADLILIEPATYVESV